MPILDSVASLLHELGATKGNRQNVEHFVEFSVHGKTAWDGPKWSREGFLFFSVDPDLADILGRTDLDFENFHFFMCWLPNFWLSRFPDFQDMVQAGLGTGQARLPKNVDFLL